MIRTRRVLDCLVLIALVASLNTLTVRLLVVNIAIGLIAYLLVPGILFQLALFRVSIVTLPFLLYSFGISIACWLIGSLLLNTTLPWFVTSRPLSLTAMTVFYICGVALLFGIAYWRVKDASVKLPLGRLRRCNRYIVGLSLCLPFLAVAGSTTLNNSGSGRITIGMLLVTGLIVIIISLRADRITAITYPITLVSMSLALLLMYSMRSWHLLGFDINNELRVFTYTLKSQRWLMSSYPHEAYNACVSITLLPTVLSELLHMSPEYVFKFLYPVMFSSTGLLVYSVARRFLSPVLSFFGGALCVVEAWYFEQMPTLARQEIGLIFFGLLILCIVDRDLVGARRWTLTYLFIGALVLSHYSTAYVWLLLITTACVVSYGTTLFLKQRKVPGSNVTILMVLVTLSMMVVWQGPMTQSSGNATMVAATAPGQLRDAFSPSVIADGVRTAFSALPSTNTDAVMRSAYASAIQHRAGSPQDYYSPSTYSGYAPHAKDDRTLARLYIPPTAAQVLRRAIMLCRDLVIDVFTVIGIAILTAWYVRKRSKSRCDMALLSVSSLLLMVVMLASPYMQENYNLSRLFVQVYMILSISSVIGFSYVMKHFRRVGVPIIGLSVLIVFVFSTGLLDQVTGGPLRISMTQPRGNIDPFYVYDGEFAGARWIANNRKAGEPVYADVFTGLRLEAYANTDSISEVFPSTIMRDGYVYLGMVNIDGRFCYINYRNSPMVYEYPIEFLNAHKDLIYNNGQSEVYR